MREGGLHLVTRMFISIVSRKFKVGEVIVVVIDHRSNFPFMSRGRGVGVRILVKPNLHMRGVKG